MFPAEFHAILSTEMGFLRNYLPYCCGFTCRLSAGTFALASSSFSAGNSAGKFPADFKNRSKQLPTKVLAGNQNPQENSQEMCFLRIFGQILQENPQVKWKFLVVLSCASTYIQ
jgi:hypothetical protein